MALASLKKFIDSLVCDDFEKDNKASGKKILITGTPGTGKTHLLIETVDYIVSKKNVDPGKLLVFCFNRKWAKILREQTALKINKSFFEIEITSFFAFCADFLMEFGHSLKNIEILNAPQQWKLLKEIIENKLDSKKYPLTCRYANKNDFLFNSFVQEAFDFILRAQENLLKPADILNNAISESDPMVSELGGIYMHYRNYLRENHLFNYGRLLQDTAEILAAESDAREEIKRRFRIIIIDEAAEMNRAQNEILKCITNRACIFFGNDNESIYAFRGSMHNSFRQVYKEVGKENYDKSGSSGIINLKKNYRSSPLINLLCNEFISLNQLKSTEELFLSDAKDKDVINNKKEIKSLYEQDGNIVLKEFHNVIDETNFICSQVKRLLTFYKIEPEKICILVKGLGYKTKLLESALNRHNLPFIRRSTRTVLDNPFVIYLINFARLTVLLAKVDDAADTGCGREIDSLLVSILTSGFLRINPVFVMNLYRGSDATGCNRNGENNFWIEINRYAENSQNNDSLISFIESVKNHMDFHKISAYDFLFNVFTDKRTGLLEFIFDDKNMKPRQREAAFKIIGDFLSTAGDFPENIDFFINFLDDLSSGSFLEEIEESSGEVLVPGNLNILSFHQAKGLEFDAVIIPFMNKSYLPSDYKDTQLYDSQIFNYLQGGSKYTRDTLRKMHFEQERQLFYTGISRARNHLYITSCQTEERSVFFEELVHIFKKQRLQNHPTSNQTNEDRNYYSLPDNNWLARKKAVVGMYRIKKSMFLDKENFLKTIIILENLYPPDRWWPNILTTVNRKKPFDFYDSSYSYSSLSAYRQCPLIYKLKYFFRMAEPESLTFKVGKIYHEILNSFFSEYENNDFENLRSIVIEIIEKHNFDFAFLKREVLKTAVAHFEKFHSIYIKDQEFNGLVEKDFSFYINDNLIKGRIDQIKFVNDESVELIDFKSGSKSISEAGMQKDIQLPLYGLAVNLSCDLDMAKGREVVMKYIFLGDKNCAQVLVSYDSLDFDNFVKTITGIIDEIKKENFSANPVSRYECRNCTFKINCSY